MSETNMKTLGETLKYPPRKKQLSIEARKKRYWDMILSVFQGATMKQAAMQNGYLTTDTMNTAVFKECLAEIDDGYILGRVAEILQKEDARASLAAAQMLLKLKDRFPAGKLKIQELNDELGDLSIDAED